MVVYDLSCEQQHRFEGWFASPETFDTQIAKAEIACPACGSRNVKRRPSAAYVNTRGSSGEGQQPVATTVAEAGELLAKLVAYLRQHTVDVGRDFPEQARKLHYGELEPRGIRGTATQSEIVELKEEGIDVLPLPIDIDSPDKLQ